MPADIYDVCRFSYYVICILNYWLYIEMNACHSILLNLQSTC